MTSSLKDRQNQIIRKMRQEGFVNSEIAERLGVSRTEVGMRVKLLRASKRQKLPRGGLFKERWNGITPILAEEEDETR